MTGEVSLLMAERSTWMRPWISLHPVEVEEGVVVIMAQDSEKAVEMEALQWQRVPKQFTSLPMLPITRLWR